MASSRKLSGAQFKKLRLDREESTKKQQNLVSSWLTFNVPSIEQERKNQTLSECSNKVDQTLNILKVPHCESFFKPSSTAAADEVEATTSTTVPDTSAEDAGTATATTIKSTHIGAATADAITSTLDANAAASTTVAADFLYWDPATWSAIGDKVRCLLINHGPEQDQREQYPPSSSTTIVRHFNKTWFEKLLPNGEKVNRQWLLYSASKDKIFCFACILFSKSRVSSFADLEKGMCDWKKLNPRVPEHENSSDHRQCYQLWKEMENKLKKEKTIDNGLQRAINAEREKWRNILKVIIKTIFFCAKNNLAFRGSTDIVGDYRSGIFLSALELISNYNLQFAEHLEAAKSKSTLITYFSPRIQNELIILLGNKVKDVIISDIKAAKYFSILFDCTPDASHKEQMSQIIRYVLIKEGQCTIEESFVDFIESHQKTGAGLAAEITDKLKRDGLKIEDCRGQGYDNGANMAGKYNGVQARINGLNELAIFVPCAAHTLNLVGVHAAEV